MDQEKFSAKRIDLSQSSLSIAEFRGTIGATYFKSLSGNDKFWARYGDSHKQDTEGEKLANKDISPTSE